MKKKVVAILNDIVEEIDGSYSIDKSDTLVGKHVVIDAKDLECIKDNIRCVVKIIKNEIDFDDALKGNDIKDFNLEDFNDDKTSQYAKEIINKYGSELNYYEIMKAIDELQVDWSNHGELELMYNEKTTIIMKYNREVNNV